MSDVIRRLGCRPTTSKGAASVEATLEPRLVIQGNEGKPFVSGEFFVAAYQRGYRWGRAEVRQLLDDITRHAREAKARRAAPDPYYLQPVVVIGRPGREDSWELVDGQQRLTTLYLITKFIGRKLGAESDVRVGYDLTYETRSQDGLDSRRFLQDLNADEREANIDYHHIAAAYEAIDEWFGEQGNAVTAATSIYEALSEWVFVIWYEAVPAPDDADFATGLFTRLNRDRIPLTDSELIKALVLSRSGAAEGRTNRQQEIAAQWDSFERDLRDDQFWAFLTGSTSTRSTHIDLLFESMTPTVGLKARPRFWTFLQVFEDVQERGAAAFWRDVVERHGLLTGWYRDRELYHRIGYLVATGDSIPALIELSRSQTHSAFRQTLDTRTRDHLRLTESDVSLLSYDSDKSGKCTDVLLLMNVETVLMSDDPGSRFSFHAYAADGWSLEHIHAQNSQDLKTDAERRDWLSAHLTTIRETTWGPAHAAEVDDVAAKMDAHLAMPPTKTDPGGFQNLADRVFALFSATDATSAAGDIHGLGNLALLQKDLNSKLNNAVFAIKRERILELDKGGAYILPCTRNVFLKYYTSSAQQQLSFWSPQDQAAYFDRLIETISDFLLVAPNPEGSAPDADAMEVEA